MRPIEATYENGFLKLAEAVPLKSGELVSVILVRKPDPSRWDRVKLAATSVDDEVLTRAGLQEWSEGLEALDRP